MDRPSRHPAVTRAAQPGRRSVRPTILDVAHLADVSQATVSRVVNGGQDVRHATRARVEHAMRDLGYVANGSARALARGRTQVIGLLAQDVDDVFVTAVIAGVDRQVSAQGYDLLLCTTHARRDTEADYVARLARGMVDGLLIVLPGGLPAHVARLRDDGFPFVLIGHDDEAPGCSVVSVANRRGARDAIRHLIGLGHRHIGFITGRDDVGAARARLAGYRDEMDAAGLGVRPDDVVPGDFTETRGHAAAIEMLSRGDPPTAIVGSGDMAALGILRAADELGIPVPARLSVMGFDDIPEAARVDPPLTTVHQPLREMGRAAVDQLLGCLADPGRPPSRVTLDTSLVVRGTTGPPG